MEKAPRPGGAAEVPVAPVARCLGLLGPVKFGDSSRWVFFFWPQLVACGILVPRPGIRAMPPASGAQSLNPSHGTAREVSALSDV